MAKYAKFDPNTNMSVLVIRMDEGAPENVSEWVKIPENLENAVRYKISSKGVVSEFTETDTSNEILLSAREIFMKSLRDKRDMLLKNSDWTEFAGAAESHSADWNLAWKTYRQALRDFPNNYDVTKSDLILENVVWPTPPA